MHAQYIHTTATGPVWPTSQALITELRDLSNPDQTVDVLAATWTATAPPFEPCEWHCCPGDGRNPGTVEIIWWSPGLERWSTSPTCRGCAVHAVRDHILPDAGDYIEVTIYDHDVEDDEPADVAA